jgi:hypothetical protein
MINHQCEICKQYVANNWVMRIYDDHTSVDVNGHKSCIDELDIRFKQIKDVHKKNVQKVLKELNIEL